MAGESAREVARRRREKANRLLRSADLYERGAAGEEATAAVLATLPADRWRVLHDVRWPGRRFANVDHVAVGPGGVFVIDSKNWSGQVTVRDDVLRQGGYRRETAVASAADAALAVAEIVRPVSPAHVHAVLCFVRTEELSGWARDVVICSTSTLVLMLTTRPQVLSVAEVELAAAHLVAVLGRGGRTSTAESARRRSTPLVQAPPLLGPRPMSRPPRARSRRRARSRPSAGPRLGGLVARLLLLGAFLLALPALPQIAERVAESLVQHIGQTPPVEAPGGEPRSGTPSDSDGKPEREQRESPGDQDRRDHDREAPR